MMGFLPDAFPLMFLVSLLQNFKHRIYRLQPWCMQVQERKKKLKVLDEDNKPIKLERKFSIY